jgi:hypothetical protein
LARDIVKIKLCCAHRVETAFNVIKLIKTNNAAEQNMSSLLLKREEISLNSYI